MIYLMRHGQDDENFIGGWSEVSLIPEGVVQANEVGFWIKENLKINRILCSSVNRAIQTADIVNKYLAVKVEYDDNLREQSKGLLNGMLKEKAEIEYSEFVNDANEDTVYPEGESLRDLYNKMKIYISKIMEMDDGTLLITHRGVINMIYYILNDIPLDFDKKKFGVETASVHELDVSKKSIRKVR